MSGDPDKPPAPSPDGPLEPIVVSLLRYPLDSPEFADAASVAGQRRSPKRSGKSTANRVVQGATSMGAAQLGHLHRPKAADSVLASDPDTHEIEATFVLATSDQAESELQWQPRFLMEQVSRFLEGQTEPVSRTQPEERS